jgi:prenyl protein peptidase
MLLARTPVTQTVFLSPVIFGLAHIHHFYEFRVTHSHVPVIASVARSVLQLIYTTIFGAYATFLFLRTGSLLAICLVHAFCNCMGLPRVWGRVGTGEEETPGKRPSVLWSVAYYLILVAGATFWCSNLWSLTVSPNALLAISG